MNEWEYLLSVAVVGAACVNAAVAVWWSRRAKRQTYTVSWLTHEFVRECVMQGVTIARSTNDPDELQAMVNDLTHGIIGEIQE